MIDLSAREAHFLEHLAPVWRELPPELRGRAFVAPDLVDRALELELGDVAVGWPDRERRSNRPDPVLVASWGDLRIVARTRRPVVLLEHGAGQSYGGRHASYAGGLGRDAVALFVVPRAELAARNHRYYPSTPSAVVGSPRVDELARIPAPPAAPPTVAISFHWRCSVAPEAGSAIDDFAPELEEARSRLEALGVELLGHAHPRILEEARMLYDAAGIETVDRFEEVVARAHLYAVDNSSTLFEFAALDRPVVLLDARAYRRDVEHGLRFWTEADVGLHASPGELVDVVLEALLDPVDVARSRRGAVARTYARTDGTSAELAAEAIVKTFDRRRPCLVCGASRCACGPTTTVIPVDQRVRKRAPRMGNLKRYPNPNRPGAFLKLSDEDAKRLGLLGRHTSEAPARGPAAPLDAVTNEGADPLVSSRTDATPNPDLAAIAANLAASKRRPAGVPEGAMVPAGPTHRARAKTKEAAVPAPDSAEEDEEGTAPAAAPSTAPKDKARTPPTRRRRRAAAPEEG